MGLGQQRESGIPGSLVRTFAKLRPVGARLLQAGGFKRPELSWWGWPVPVTLEGSGMYWTTVLQEANSPVLWGTKLPGAGRWLANPCVKETASTQWAGEA